VWSVNENLQKPPETSRNLQKLAGAVSGKFFMLEVANNILKICKKQPSLKGPLKSFLCLKYAVNKKLVQIRLF
jgi:hypothetical protein